MRKLTHGSSIILPQVAHQALLAVLVTFYNSGDFLVFLGYKLAKKFNCGI